MSKASEYLFYLQICSDASTSCCSTPPLKRTFHDDWSQNDLEEWKAKYLGDCAGKKLLVEKGLGVTLSKEGKDTLEVTSIIVEASSTEGSMKESFKCGPWSIVEGAKPAGGASKLCPPSDFKYEAVKTIVATMGNEGTNDDVKVDICSDVDSACCQTKLSSLLSDDWSKNDIETWKGSDLRKCEGIKFRVSVTLKN